MGNNICTQDELTPKINELNKKITETKISNLISYDNLNIQKNDCENYKAYLSELNYQLNNLKDQLNISIPEEMNTQNILSPEENIFNK